MNLKKLLDTPPWEWPPDAGRTLHRILADRQTAAADRLIAAELAGDIVVINDEIAADLLKIVRAADEPADLRARAAIALGPVLEQADMFGFDDPMDLDDIPIEEDTFDEIKETLHTVYADAGVPKEVRRRILEASVRAEQDWHQAAITTAYASGDPDWLLTAVFASRYVQGFNRQILDALKSTDSEIHYQAVHAAGAWDLEAAAAHILALVRNRKTPKRLLLAAIEAIGSIRPKDAAKNLADLLDAEDEDIVEAAEEAIAMAEGASAADDDEEDDEAKEWIN